MVGRIRISFQYRMLLLVLGTAWLFVGAFIAWQYVREKQFKVELLDAQLQQHNHRIINDMTRGEDIGSVVRRIDPPMPDVRITLIDAMGRVTFDTNDNMGVGNHADRQEVIDARKYGKGLVPSRTSIVDDKDYFYSATQAPYGLVVRSAIPYNHSLFDTLKADWKFLWIMAGISVIISIIGWLGTKQVSRSISRLNRFAATVEKGERVTETYTFPNDELGAISSHIISLYARWQQVMEERDIQHAEAMKAERDKERFKKQLTIDINHELKTPVASIILCMETLHDFPDLPAAKQKELEDRILQSAIRLQNMLKDVSVITRMDEGADVINMSPLPMTDIVRDVVEELRPAAAKAGMELSAKLPDEPLTVNGNAPLIEAVFRNLIRNAILYSGGTEIVVEGDREGNWVVRDNGTGIPEEHHPHIFDRFYRLEPGRSRKAGGTGLGLAIVRNAVLLHGGDIAISNANPGTVFSFNFPRLHT